MAASGCAYAPDQVNLDDLLADRSGGSDLLRDAGRGGGDDVEGTGDGDRAEGADDRQEEDEGPREDDGDLSGNRGPRLDSTEDAVRVSEGDASVTSSARDGGNVDAGGQPEVEDASTAAQEKPLEVEPPPPAPSCLPGSYRGELTGEITSSFSRERVTGTIALELVGSGDTLQVASGTIRGTDQDGNAISANVAGSLDCTSLQLSQGALSEGLYSRRGSLVSTIRFTGGVAATYSSQPAALQGTWTLESALGTRSGGGRFTALRD